MINITLPDGSVRSFVDGATGYDVALHLSEGLARKALAVRVNGEVRDLHRPLESATSFAVLTWDDPEGKATFWHSSAHLLAEALELLYPGVKLGIGPSIENGFYYDIDLGESRTISADELPEVEKKMLELARQKSRYQRRAVSKADALAYFTEKADPYKLDLLARLDDGSITFYTQGNFTDLCRGPHLPNTGPIKAIKLLNVAGAYWRGDVKNKQLTRIYGISFPKATDLAEYLERLQEAKRRDHRKLGKELELFAFSEKVGAGLPLWLPRGTALRERLEQFLRRAQRQAGYQPVVTPHIGAKELYVTAATTRSTARMRFSPSRRRIRRRNSSSSP